MTFGLAGGTAAVVSSVPSFSGASQSTDRAKEKQEHADLRDENGARYAVADRRRFRTAQQAALLIEQLMGECARSREINALLEGWCREAGVVRVVKHDSNVATTSPGGDAR